ALADAEAQEAVARADLKAALGHDEVETEWPWKTRISSDTAIDTFEFKLESRPDWRSLIASTEEERLKKHQALGALLPSLDLSFTYGNADLSTPDRRDWKTLLTLTVPLFNGFQNYADYRIQGALYNEAEYRLDDLKRTAISEV